MIAAQSDNVIWITFYTYGAAKTKARMTFIGGESSPSPHEFDVVGGQAFYGVPTARNRYAWGGQITCFIHMRAHYIASARKIVCTAIVRRGSKEQVLASIFVRATRP